MTVDDKQDRLDHTQEKIMFFDFEDVNRILDEMVDDGMVEPIDDPSIQTDFYDWADIVGILDQVEPETHFA